MDAGEEWTGVESYLYLDIKLSIMASSADQVSNCKVLISTFVGGSRLNDTTRAFHVPWYSAITTKLPSEINGLTNLDINPTISFYKNRIPQLSAFSFCRGAHTAVLSNAIAHLQTTKAVVVLGLSAQHPVSCHFNVMYIR
jgi:hypothetical protein